MMSHKNSGFLFASLMLVAPLITTAAETPNRGNLSTTSFSGSKLKLRWELQRNEFTSQIPQGRTLARLSLTNLNSTPLPSRGWGLYFNCVDGVELGTLKNHLAVEQVSGSLFRIVPLPGFTGLAPQQTLVIDYSHPDLVVKLSKAPTGPYLVVDHDSEVGLAIKDYQIALMTRPEQLNKGASDPTPLVSAAAIFDQNRPIVELAAATLPPIFPTPLRLEKRQDKLHLQQLPAIIADAGLQDEAAYAKALLQPYFPSAPTTAVVAPLRLKIAPIADQTSAEAYELGIDAKTGITITGNHAAGVVRGLASLHDLLPIKPNPAQAVVLNALSVTDAPRFDYRGFQLDVSRNFHSKATIFKLLDLMARYKINKFHFHLTDDEGWRLEIPGIPELTEIGARRGHTLLPVQAYLQPAYGSGPDVRDAAGSGFYSRADYIDILKYAAVRHIDVIPEIEIPGHARAAVIAMQSRYHRFEKSDPIEARKYLLNDFDDKSVYKSPQLYGDNVINPGLASSYVFIEQVVAQVAAMHRDAGVPLTTMHVGGDELADGAWEKSPASQAFMKRMKLNSTEDLWDYFYQQVNVILHKYGLFASGWEELGARKTKLRGVKKLIPNPLFTQNNFNLYVWNNVDGAEDFAYRLANAGYKIVLAPVTKMYLDMAVNKNPEEPGVNWGGYVDLNTVYDFIPLDYLKDAGASMSNKDGLTDFGRKNVVGLEAILFTETVRDAARIDYMIMPRLLGLAERAWAADPAWAQEPDAKKAAQLHRAAWSNFVNVIGKRILPKLDAEQPDLAYRIPPPGLNLRNGNVLVNHQLPGMVLRYTNDGSAPTPSSDRVVGPIAAKGLIQVAAFDQNGRRGHISTVENH